MVLPLLPVFAGLLATGAAGAAGSRYFSDMMDERKEDRAREKQGSVWDGIMANANAAGMDGSGMGIPGAGGAPGAGGPAGLLSPPGAQGAGSTMPDMLRVAQGLGSAGYMDDALGILGQERAYGVQEASATTAFNRQLQRDEIQQQYQQQNISQSQGPAWARLEFDKAKLRAAQEQNRDPTYEGVAVKPEQYIKFSSQDGAVDTLEQVKVYARDTNAAGRAGDRERRERLRSEYQMTVLPALQQLFQAGAMQEGEMELFQKLGGDPLAWNNVLAREGELGKVQAVINKLEQQRKIEREAYGVPYVPRTLSGSSGGAALPPGASPYTPGG